MRREPIAGSPRPGYPENSPPPDLIPNADHRRIPNEPNVFRLERDQLTPRQGAGPADQKQGLIA